MRVASTCENDGYLDASASISEAAADDTLESCRHIARTCSTALRGGGTPIAAAPAICGGVEAELFERLS